MATSKIHRPISISGFLYPALLFLGAGAIVVHFAEGKQVWQLLRQSNWWWIALAALWQLLLLLNQSALYGAAYRLTGLPEATGRLFLLVLAASFTAAAVPGGAFSGAGLMVYDAARRGLDTARAMLANVVFFLLDYLAFLLILALALFYLFFHGALQEYQLIATGILTALVLAGFLLLAFGSRKPAAGAFSGNKPDKIGQPFPLGSLFRKKSAWAERFAGLAAQLAEAASALRADKPGLFRAALHALLMELIGLLQLEALFLAFGSHPAPGQLIAGYAVGVLFMIVSITPSGVGIMEGAMAAAYVSVGIPLSKATLVTFTYRALSFWLPVFAGFFVMRRVFRE
ncbi:MAG: lysylphosphatidylglycerol synthase transmembrane domain-containing protein [Bacillota bacterium]